MRRPDERHRRGVATDDDLLRIAQYQEPDEALARARVERVRQLERLHAPLVEGMTKALKTNGHEAAKIDRKYRRQP